MDSATLDRLFGVRDAFAEPVVVIVTIATFALLAISIVGTFALSRVGKLSPALADDLRKRNRSWLILVPLLGLPVLAGAAWTILAVTIASLACYREFARATGMFREKLVSSLVVVGILALGFASLDNWYGFFEALPALMLCVLLAVPIAQDRPKRYIQRTGLGIMAFMIFGVGLAHLGFIANDPDYRSIILMILFCVQLNDVMAFVCGKAFGHRKIAPRTSPNKTLGGSLGALVITTTVAAFLGHLVFQGGPLDEPTQLVALGLLIAIGGQLGDLVLSSIKRDVGVKDMAATFPGHGGLLDRLNSTLLVAPAAFHYIHYVRGIAIDTPARILSGGF
ncbi:MAG: phosphatidate cytidylyltransferase [Phycisphaerae bacterium]|nr:phosphatidate cytidylyltransferase [Phycisphaerae bacterium]